MKTYATRSSDPCLIFSCTVPAQNVIEHRGGRGGATIVYQFPFKLTPEVRSWLVDNICGYYSWNRDILAVGTTFLFEHENEAAIFKLRWG